MVTFFNILIEEDFLKECGIIYYDDTFFLQYHNDKYDLYCWYDHSLFHIDENEFLKLFGCQISMIASLNKRYKKKIVLCLNNSVLIWEYYLTFSEAKINKIDTNKFRYVIPNYDLKNLEKTEILLEIYSYMKQKWNLFNSNSKSVKEQYKYNDTFIPDKSMMYFDELFEKLVTSRYLYNGKITFNRNGIEFKKDENISADYWEFNQPHPLPATYIKQWKILQKAGLIELNNFNKDCFCIKFNRNVTLSDKVNLPLLYEYILFSPQIKNSNIINNLKLSDFSILSEKSNKAKVKKNINISQDDFLEIYKKKLEKGDLSEKRVFEFEKQSLLDKGRSDLADLVKLVSDEVTLGFDILSFSEDGVIKNIEVKTVSKNSKAMSFYISKNELQRSLDDENYHIYCVEELGEDDYKIHILPNSLKLTDSDRFELEPVNYKVKFNLK